MILCTKIRMYWLKMEWDIRSDRKSVRYQFSFACACFAYVANQFGAPTTLHGEAPRCAWSASYLCNIVQKLMEFKLTRTSLIKTSHHAIRTSVGIGIPPHSLGWRINHLHTGNCIWSLRHCDSFWYSTFLLCLPVSSAIGDYTFQSFNPGQSTAC